MARVFIGCPTYDGRLDAETAAALYLTASQQHELQVCCVGKSLLASNCNGLLATALNQDPPVDWFAMLHADIAPDAWWLDTLIDEAEANSVDMLSAVVPIKDNRGLTSTAIGPANGLEAYGRLTVSQVLRQLPKTFDVDAACDLVGVDTRDNDPCLYLNTGCMIFRRDKWKKGIHFAMVDYIDHFDGQWRMRDFSEDWYFSTMAHAAGLNLAATTSVKVRHKGSIQFPSGEVWGTVTNELPLRETQRV